MKASKGEEKIIQLLQKDGYKFEREKRFGNLKKGRYRFDFYVQGGRPCVIEYNGEQHYRYISKFHKSYRDLTAGQERDRRKINYCLANQIPIYIIPFWELDKIHTATDLFKDKYRAYDHWKNDKDYASYISTLRQKREFDRMFENLL